MSSMNASPAGAIASIPPAVAAGEPSSGSTSKVCANADALVTSPRTTWARMGGEDGGARFPARKRTTRGTSAATTIASVASQPLHHAMIERYTLAPST